jgi:hypothetical protein
MIGTIVYALVATGSVLVGDGVHPDITKVKMISRKRKIRILIGNILIIMP